MNQTGPSTQLQIGSLIFPRVDQIDFTGPFEVFSRIPNAICLTIAKERGPLRDGRGLILTPEKTFAEVGQLDLLLVAGGPGQEALMDDEETLSFIRDQSINAKYIFSVCTGALILGAAGLLRGKKLDIQYAPDPPFNSGSVTTAPAEVVSAVRAKYQPLTDARLVTARRISAKLGIKDGTPGNR
jgi:cyclohexyl-isocyanide hydratase